MKKITKLNIITGTLLSLPLAAWAQQSQVLNLIEYIMDIVENLIILAAALALLAFMWGLTRFIFKVGGDEKAIEQGKNLMKWGLIALFVMMSVWGIIRFFQDEFELDNSALDINFPIR
ncbi:hypothetical protein KW796_00325 [Candidatus Parcubacteria bacterium]|nr:hypothetical protein [Candidatus Parcubacteria bacterium]